MYRYLPHTADELLEVKAKTLKDALRDAVLGSFELIGKGKHEEEEFEIEVHSPTLEDLVVDLLQQAVVQCELREISPLSARVLEANERHPSAKILISGEKIAPPNEIKAVTYHRLRVEKKKGGWEIDVLFDV
ncbi:MAG: archease [Candidatus Bilamarchaeaceae archaeon]